MTNEQSLMMAIRMLRDAAGLSQLEFAAVLNKSYPTIQRYERVRPPRGFDLMPFLHLARGNNLPDLVEIFKSAIIEGITPDIREIVLEAEGFVPSINPSTQPSAPHRGAQNDSPNVVIAKNHESNKISAEGIMRRWSELLQQIPDIARPNVEQAVTGLLESFSSMPSAGLSKNERNAGTDKTFEPLEDIPEVASSIQKESRKVRGASKGSRGGRPGRTGRAG